MGPTRKKRRSYVSYDTNVDESPRPLEGEAVDVEAEVSVRQNEPIEQAERDRPIATAFEE
jgi:hypothetical protein